MADTKACVHCGGLKFRDGQFGLLEFCVMCQRSRVKDASEEAAGEPTKWRDTVAESMPDCIVTHASPAPVAGGEPTPCPKCTQFRDLLAVCPGCSQPLAPVVAPVAGAGEEEPTQGEPRVCMVEEHDRTRTLCGRAWVRPPEAHGTRVYQCQACLRIATLTASLASMQRERDRLARQVELHQRQIERRMPCADHRDKVADGVCLVCRAEAAESRLATLHRERDEAQAMADEMTENSVGLTQIVQEQQDRATAAESRLGALDRERGALREALYAMATAGRALYEEGAGEGDPRAQEALWTAGKRLYETACNMAATLSEPPA